MLNKIDKYRILRHLAFWVLWLTGMSVFYGMNPRENIFLSSFLSMTVSMPVYIIYSYFMVYYIMPRSILQKKIFVFLLYLISFSLLFSFLLRLDFKYLFYPYFLEQDYRNIHLLDWFPLISNMIWVNVPLFMFAGTKFIYNYSIELSHKKELENLNARAELSMLTVQLRPHFLFNTLNNLYSLAVRNDKRTSDGLSRVINLLKYILFVCNEDKVSLKKEIGLIYDYIELEKIRYDERLDFKFEVRVEDKEVKIIPLVLFTFIENSFKHGSSPEAGNSFIHINIESDHHKLSFLSRNSFPETRNSLSGNGLGLQNVKKRLDLLYKNRYHLDLVKGDDVFEVKLELEL